MVPSVGSVLEDTLVQTSHRNPDTRSECKQVFNKTTGSARVAMPIWSKKNLDCELELSDFLPMIFGEQFLNLSDPQLLPWEGVHIHFHPGDAASSPSSCGSAGSSELLCSATASSPLGVWDTMSPVTHYQTIIFSERIQLVCPFRLISLW